MVFTRKRPKNYVLTDKGTEIAQTLEKIRYVVAETAVETTRFNEKEREKILQMPSGTCIRPLEKENETDPPTTMRYLNPGN
ncbi:hypothetical protein MUP01_07510 [Candidatus Bathyarchaeota archaeon]|nr:hypothetical protein [Candidatus Bathyarchaeota archaeon]